jgi:hypothetical protein
MKICMATWHSGSCVVFELTVQVVAKEDDALPPAAGWRPFLAVAAEKSALGSTHSSDAWSSREHALPAAGLYRTVMSYYTTRKPFLPIIIIIMASPIMTATATITPTTPVYRSIKEPPAPTGKYSLKDAMEDVLHAYCALNLFVVGSKVENQGYTRKADPKVYISSLFVLHSVQLGSTIATSLPFPPHVLSYSSRCTRMLILLVSGCLSQKRRMSFLSRLSRLSRLLQHPSNEPSSFVHLDSTSEPQYTSTLSSAGISTESASPAPPNSNSPSTPVSHCSC